MPVTMRDVVRQLSPDEANLNQAAAALGAEALPYLEALVRGPDPLLALKAAYVAAQIADPRAIEVLRLSATNRDRMVRMAAATALRSLPADASGDLLATLLVDSDAECRRIAIEAVPEQVTPRVRQTIEMLALTDPYPFLRELSARVLARAPAPSPNLPIDRKNAE
jgi:HEAT repeats